MANQLKIIKQEGSYILYDANLISAPTLQLFDRDYHTNNVDQQNNSVRQVSSEAGIGRARVSYFEHEGIKLVLKHYYRGGLIASIVKDKYLGFDIEKTRAFKEFRLLEKMQKLGLPVPAVIAARVEKGPFYFRADLITKEIEGARTLSDTLTNRPLDAVLWKKIGHCIKAFHLHNIYHADLNARNILLSEPGDVYLIDFDNSGFRLDSESWKMMNLARLKRSLLKFKKNTVDFNFDENAWSALLDGYKN